MGNPYISQAISGYNTSPPPDDGSQTSANTVRWATHKTKLADPIKTLSEAINSELLLAFGLTLGQGIRSVSTVGSLLASDRGQFIQFTGASTFTFTLLAVATAGDGFPVVFINNGTSLSGITIDGDGAETINGGANLLLHPGDSAVLTCDGSVWVATGEFTEFGTFTPTYTGFSVDPTGDAKWQKRGNMISVLLPVTTGTSDTTGFVIGNLPAAVTPPTSASSSKVPVHGLIDDNAEVRAGVVVSSSSLLTFENAGNPSGWTAAASTKGFDAGSGPLINYPFRLVAV